MNASMDAATTSGPCGLGDSWTVTNSFTPLKLKSSTNLIFSPWRSPKRRLTKLVP